MNKEEGARRETALDTALWRAVVCWAGQRKENKMSKPEYHFVIASDGEKWNIVQMHPDRDGNVCVWHENEYRWPTDDEFDTVQGLSEQLANALDRMSQG
jgi:hypothetical protein